MTHLLRSLVASDDPAPFALLAREGTGVVEVLTGTIVDVDLLADIPLDCDGVPREVLAIVPYRQVIERGFEAIDDAAPLRCLIVDQRESVPLAVALGLLPAGEVPITTSGFDISDADYAEVVRRVIDDEIGKGEGANFVIRRDFHASTEVAGGRAVLTWMRALLTRESGAYWTFAVSTPGLAMVGATPERHVSVSDGVVTMNPISGTYRHPATGPDAAAFAEFLRDGKETEELFMVVDEELKMMSAVCSSGGRIEGPFLKQMSRLTHTEYLLSGTSDLDPRDILRETMFAPTVTGSPIENACAVIARHERRPRGYYAGVIALFSPDDRGGHRLDAPILIRTAYLDGGRITVPAGATLVRHSVPESEVAETHAKAGGLLSALGMTMAVAPSSGHVRLADDARLVALLDERNARLAPFWLQRQAVSPQGTGTLDRRSAIIVDAEDRFTTMLGHQLRHLGMTVRIVPWREAGSVDLTADLLVAGPGPGDPRLTSEPRIRVMSDLIAARRASGLPLLAVCLSHQILCTQLGLPIEPLAAPRQGVQHEVDLFGRHTALGFYNTFTARLTDPSLPPEVEASVDRMTGDVFAVRGPGFASVQGHLESVLSHEGIDVLAMLAEGTFAPVSAR